MKTKLIILDTVYFVTSKETPPSIFLTRQKPICKIHLIDNSTNFISNIWYKNCSTKRICSKFSSYIEKTYYCGRWIYFNICYKWNFGVNLLVTNKFEKYYQPWALYPWFKCRNAKEELNSQWIYFEKANWSL